MSRTRLFPSFALALLLATGSAAAQQDISKVNGSVLAQAGQQYGDVSTVNGSVTVETGASLQDENPATRFSLPNFIMVGAVDRNGAATDWTNSGTEISLFANGDRVPARLPGEDHRLFRADS